LYEITTWEVLSLDKQIRIGVIRQLNDHYRNVQQFPAKFWLGSSFYPSFITIGNTRKEVIEKMLEQRSNAFQQRVFQINENHSKG
jgi:hypothetical protein